MKKQLEQYDITSIEQAKIFSNDLRMKILDQFFDQRPRTAKQVADEMGLSPSKVHYHVRELLKVGLLFLYETKEINGILEKYYLPIAKEFRIILKQLENDVEGKQQIVNHAIGIFKKSIMDSFKDGEEKLLQIFNLKLSEIERDELINELKDLAKRWEEKSKENSSSKDEYGVLLSVIPKKM
ncbi:MAG: helix-turn-helix domain-containing protein [Bacillota bacterium]|nr:helix-turn-helix domain-containing protein [Bacillota bacterium]